MSDVGLLFVIGLPLSVGVGLAGPRLVRSSGWLRLPRAEPGRRMPVAAVWLSAVTALSVAVTIVVGELTFRLADVDERGFRWFLERFDPSSTWTDLNDRFTLIGDPPLVEAAVIVVALGGAVAFVRAGLRAWTVPVAAVLAYVLQRVGQEITAELVGDAPARPPDLGTYPSGGVSRLLAVWGVGAVVVWLASGRRPAVGRALSTFICVVTFVEAYTRVVLLKHWPSDLLGGLILGLGVVVAVGGSLALVSDPDAAEAAE